MRIGVGRAVGVVACLRVKRQARAIYAIAFRIPQPSTKRRADVLSVLFAESSDNLAHLVRFYAPHADRLLDVTFGAGTLSKRVSVPVVGVDKDPESKAAIIADSAQALPFNDGAFTAAVYDPPYLYGVKA